MSPLWKINDMSNRLNDLDPYITYLIELTNYFNNWNFMQQSWQ